MISTIEAYLQMINSKASLIQINKFDVIHGPKSIQVVDYPVFNNNILLLLSSRFTHCNQRRVRFVIEMLSEAADRTLVRYESTLANLQASMDSGTAGRLHDCTTTLSLLCSMIIYSAVRRSDN